MPEFVTWEEFNEAMAARDSAISNLQNVLDSLSKLQPATGDATRPAIGIVMHEGLSYDVLYTRFHVPTLGMMTYAELALNAEAIGLLVTHKTGVLRLTASES
jgi:hypothetical protein